MTFINWLFDWVVYWSIDRSFEIAIIWTSIDWLIDQIDDSDETDRLIVGHEHSRRFFGSFDVKKQIKETDEIFNDRTDQSSCERSSDVRALIDSEICMSNGRMIDDWIIWLSKRICYEKSHFNNGKFDRNCMSLVEKLIDKMTDCWLNNWHIDKLMDWLRNDW